MLWSRAHAMSVCFPCFTKKKEKKREKIRRRKQTKWKTFLETWQMIHGRMSIVWVSEWAICSCLMSTDCLFIPSSQPPQYVPPSSKSKRPPFIWALPVDEFAFAAAVGVVAVVVVADPGEFGAIAKANRTREKERKHKGLKQMKHNRILEK